MNRHKTNGPHDPRVVEFRPRPKPRAPRPDFKRPLIIFASLFVLVLAMQALLGGGVGLRELITALVLATVVTGADLLRGRGGAA